MPALGHMGRDKYHPDLPISFDFVMAFHCFGLPCWTFSQLNFALKNVLLIKTATSFMY